MTSRITRRQLVLGAGVSGAALLAGCGRLPFQRPPPTAVKLYRLGFLNGLNPAAAAPILDIFRQALGELGYVEGQNLAIEYRWGEGSNARLVEPAAELARLPVDVIVVPSTGVGQIAREATTVVPVVLAGFGDPVADGLAASYARPGGNVTGVTILLGALAGKRLQLLKEVAPSISRVAVLWAAETLGLFPAEARHRDAQTVGVQLHLMVLHGPEELDAAFEHAAREGTDALLVPASALANAHRAQIIQLSARYRWPAMYPRRDFVDEGGLMTYDASLPDLWRRAAVHVDKILKGASPAELPIEQPQRFDFILNRPTADALGLTLPESIRLQVTEVLL